MLAPKRIKHRKRFKGKVRGKAWSGNDVSYGSIGLLATSSARLTSRQIEAARIAMTRHVKRGGRIYIRCFPHTPITKKPAETRMGKGKGSPEYWVAIIRPGQMLYEMDGVDEDLAREALQLAASKLPMSTKVVLRDEVAL